MYAYFLYLTLFATNFISLNVKYMNILRIFFFNQPLIFNLFFTYIYIVIEYINVKKYSRN